MEIMDEAAVKIANYCDKMETNSIEYLIASETKLLTKSSYVQPTFSALAYQFANTPDILNNLFAMVFQSLSCEDNLLKCFKHIDISSCQLTPPFIKLLVDALQHCCVEKITTCNTEIIEEITCSILDINIAEKNLCNYNSGKPLIVTSIDKRPQSSIFLVGTDRKVTEEFLITYLFNSQQKLFLINCMHCDEGMSTVQLASMPLKKVFHFLHYDTYMKKVLWMKS